MLAFFLITTFGRYPYLVERTEKERVGGRAVSRPMTDKKKLDKAVKLYESGEFTVAHISLLSYLIQILSL